MNALKILLFTLTLLCGVNIQAQNSKSRLNANEFYQKIKLHPQALIIDTRPAYKFSEDRIKGAILAEDQLTLEALIKDVPKSDAIFIYCQIGDRSRRALKVLKSKGYTKVFELQDGLITWIEADLPLDKTPVNN